MTVSFSMSMRRTSSKKFYTMLSENTRGLQRYYHFISASKCIPHPEKKVTGGEDALFTDKFTIGIADGVGGWAKQGIDSGAYSRQLMSFAKEFAATADEIPLRTPKEIISGAFSRMNVKGSTTACLVQIHGTTLRGFNLGDSGYLVCRQDETWRTIFRSNSQSHYFNCPYQLGHDSRDQPRDAEITQFKVEPHDIVLAATDGVFDNLFETEIIRLLDTTLPETKSICDSHLENLAKSIADRAHSIAKSRTKVTPFTKAAAAAGYKYLGGKMDDISVIAAYISPPLKIQSKL